MANESATLRRELGVPGAVLLGLGSILGTGAFVSLAVAAGVAGPGVLVAVVIAGALATCNGLSSAQLAGAHPVAGGTYAYGYRYLTPGLGFAAGWLFLTAKSASAATAALGAAGYLSRLWSEEPTGTQSVGLALALVGAMVGVVVLGVRRSTWLNAALVTVTVAALLLFVAAGLWANREGFADRLGEPWGAGPTAIAHAAALVFVAFTGYGRVATLGEEVREPRRTIPRAVAATLAVAALLYFAVSFVGVTLPWPLAFQDGRLDPAPLDVIDGLAEGGSGRALGWVVGVGAVTAMLGVLLNLILGLSRVMLAMGREGDVPRVFARLDAAGKTPLPAVLLVGVVIAGLALLGSVETAWTFSAVTVLVYYGLTNAAALRLPPEDRLFPRWVSWTGLAGCVSLAAFVPWPYAVAAAGVVGVGFGVRAGVRRWKPGSIG